MATVTSSSLCSAPALALAAAPANSSKNSARAQLGAPALKSRTLSKPLEWKSKTASNGSRVNAFNVVDPNNNLKYETLSFLPPLTDEQILAQVEYIIKNGWIPAIEFDKSAKLTREGSKMPGYYEGRYWVMWKLPLFGAKEASSVLGEVQNCKGLYPDAFIRVIGFDSVRQVQVVSFIVVKPPGY